MCAAPDALSSATNISPIGPHPSTAYDLPGRRSSFCSAPIAQLTGSVSTAVSTGVPAGSLIACDCGMTWYWHMNPSMSSPIDRSDAHSLYCPPWHIVQCPQGRLLSPTTMSPGWNASTAPPTATTSATISCPMITPGVACAPGGSSRIWLSVPQMPQASTLTSRSVGSGQAVASAPA